MDQKPHDVIPQVNMPQQQAEGLPNYGEQMISPQTEIAGAAGLEQGRAVPKVTVPGQIIGSIDPVMPQIPTAVTVTDPSLQVPMTSTPGIADDADLIEKEWVEKAKSIVAQTKNDPRQQNFEMSKIKAEYMKQRYNKDLKLSPE